MKFLLAAMYDDPLPGLGPLTPAMRERLILLGALLLVVGALLFWVLILRKKRRRTSEQRHRHHRRKSITRSTAEGVSELKQMLVERKNRKRRREHRPRNPTLAETGGLPPPRSDEPPAPSTRSSQP